MATVTKTGHEVTKTAMGLTMAMDLTTAKDITMVMGCRVVKMGMAFITVFRMQMLMGETTW